MSVKYAVYDNNRPASVLGHNVHSSWDNHLFDTLEEAQEYANKWLGAWSPGTNEFLPNSPYDYSGYGDMIEIRTV